MKLPEGVYRQFQAHGRRGGRARARNMSPQERRAVARLAAVRRWTRERFGEGTFASLGVPGGALVDAGIADLAAGGMTTAALVVSLAAPRLRREGVPIPATWELFPDADHHLYRLLERSEGDLAHARYLAYLEEAESFADALSGLGGRGGRAA